MHFMPVKVHVQLCFRLRSLVNTLLMFVCISPIHSYLSGPCMGDPCFPSVDCHNVGNGSFVCESCPDGFEGDGKSCTDIDEVTF